MARCIGDADAIFPEISPGGRSPTDARKSPTVSVGGNTQSGLATVRSLDRAREVSVRKALGAGRKQLAAQFVGETMVAGLLAALPAFVLIVVLYGPFRDITQITPMLFSAEQRMVWGVFVGLVVLGGLLSSLYPALVLSAFQPVQVLKGRLSRVPGRGYLRQGLIVFQFVAAIVLLSCTGAVYFQPGGCHPRRVRENPPSGVYAPSDGSFARDGIAAQATAGEPSATGSTAAATATASLGASATAMKKCSGGLWLPPGS